MRHFFARSWNRVRSSRLRTFYERLPPATKALYRQASHWPATAAWRRSPMGQAHAVRVLAPRRNQYSGRRAVIMGNGPSLRKTDWSKVRDEFTFGTNRIYLLKEEMGFSPSVYCCVNSLVLEQFHREMIDLPGLKLLDWRAGRRFVPPDSQTVFLPEAPSMRFHRDLLTGWTLGYTVTMAALQAAFYLGFQTVILIGVDHRFGTRGPAMREVRLEGEDRDHFAPDYFGYGVRWHLPNLAGSERFYEAARSAYVAEGRQILDATDGGALEVFPKMSLEEALHRSAPARDGHALQASAQPVQRAL
ncbi:MAG: 6-hydroxymethylpterin diphosphokinase MptE-like protein [Acidobacteriota bacterium]